VILQITPTEQQPLKTESTHKRSVPLTILRVIKWVFIGVATLLILGLIYQVVSVALDRRAYLPPGQLFTVEGRQMHLYCTGSGSPTVILEAGAYSFSSEWYWVQRQLETTNRVCAYDRAGNGWSDATAGLRDGVTLAHELHALLMQADVAAPYVMVGHSLGGVLNPIYAQQYPGEVVGIVAVDSAVPIAFAFQDESEAAVERYIADNESAYQLMSTLGRFGVGRLIIGSEFRSFGYPEEIAAVLTALKSTNVAIDTWDAEVRLAQRALGEQAAEALDLGSMPLAVLWAGHPEITTPEDRERLQAIWNAFPFTSTNSVTRVIDGANHGSIVGNEQYAEQVSDAVRDVMEAASSGEPLA
jgi:pimeloyl-ACP methyl ester carboxylesterase